MSFWEKFKKNIGIEISNEDQAPGPSKVRPRRGREEPVEEKIEKPPLSQKPKPSFISFPVKSIKDKKTSEAKSFAWQSLGGEEGQLATDVYQTNGELVIQSAIAGIKPKDLDISIEADVVLIKGERQKPEELKGKRNYFYQECYWGPFSRQIILPEEVDPSRAEAIMQEGILTIRIPKIERKKKRKIIIKTKE